MEQIIKSPYLPTMMLLLVAGDTKNAFRFDTVLRRGAGLCGAGECGIAKGGIGQHANTPQAGWAGRRMGALTDRRAQGSVTTVRGSAANKRAAGRRATHFQ